MRLGWKTLRRRRSERGVSTLELAILAPAILTLIFLSIQTALWLYGRSVALNAAEEGRSRLRLVQPAGLHHRGGGEGPVRHPVVRRSARRHDLAAHGCAVPVVQQPGRHCLVHRHRGHRLAGPRPEAEGEPDRHRPDRTVRGATSEREDETGEARAADGRTAVQRGAMALEMVILAPVLLVLFMFLLACGRYFQTSSLLESAARDGARSASQARSLPDAQSRVDRGRETTMGQAIKSCKRPRPADHHRVRCRIAVVGRGHLHDQLPRPRPARPRRRHHRSPSASPRPSTRTGGCAVTAPDRQRSRVVEFFRIDAPGNHRIFSRGALSPAVAILAVMIFTLAGLVIDGGRQLGARSRAVGYAQEAARVGAAAIQLNNAEAKIDTTKAAVAITGFCAQVEQRPDRHLLRPDHADRQRGRHPGRHRQQDDVPGPDRQTSPQGRRHRPGARRARHQEGRRQPDDPADRGRTRPPTAPARRPHRDPPTIDLPCPTWTVGSPTPTWTLSPFPFPATCSPNVTPHAGHRLVHPARPSHPPARRPVRTHRRRPSRQAARDRRNVTRA